MLPPVAIWEEGAPPTLPQPLLGSAFPWAPAALASLIQSSADCCHRLQTLIPPEWNHVCLFSIQTQWPTAPFCKAARTQQALPGAMLAPRAQQPDNSLQGSGQPPPLSLHPWPHTAGGAGAASDQHEVWICSVLRPRWCLEMETPGNPVSLLMSPNWPSPCRPQLPPTPTLLWLNQAVQGQRRGGQKENVSPSLKSNADIALHHHDPCSFVGRRDSTTEQSCVSSCWPLGSEDNIIR